MDKCRKGFKLYNFATEMKRKEVGIQAEEENSYCSDRKGIAKQKITGLKLNQCVTYNTYNITIYYKICGSLLIDLEA